MGAATPSAEITKAAKTDTAWIAKIQRYYEENAEQGLTTIKVSELPKAAQKSWNKYNKDWGPDYPPDAYKYAIDGKTAFFVQDNNDGGMFVDVFDAAGAANSAGTKHTEPVDSRHTRAKVPRKAKIISANRGVIARASSGL